jgi:membrane protein DedA with SNARE-associated domain
VHALLNLTSYVSSAGYVAIFLLSILQSCCVPTSSELTLGFAGVLAARGTLSLPVVIVVAVAGEVVGAYIAWVIGRVAGRGFVDRYGKYILVSHHDLDRAEAWYRRHERWGVFGSRLLPVIRNFVALPAGIAEVPLVRFGLLTAAGSLIWDGAMAGIGYGIGAHWRTIAHAFSDAGYVLGALAVLAIILAVWHRYRSFKAATAADDDDRRYDGRAERWYEDRYSPARGTADGEPVAPTMPTAAVPQKPLSGSVRVIPPDSGAPQRPAG